MHLPKTLAPKPITELWNNFGTQLVTATVNPIKHKINVNTRLENTLWLAGGVVLAVVVIPAADKSTLRWAADRQAEGLSLYVAAQAMAGRRRLNSEVTRFRVVFADFDRGLPTKRLPSWSR